MGKDAEATVHRGDTTMHDGMWISYANRAHPEDLGGELICHTISRRQGIAEAIAGVTARYLSLASRTLPEA
jgi:hypothetical protein